MALTLYFRHAKKRSASAGVVSEAASLDGITRATRSAAPLIITPTLILFSRWRLLYAITQREHYADISLLGMITAWHARRRRF